MCQLFQKALLAAAIGVSLNSFAQTSNKVFAPLPIPIKADKVAFISFEQFTYTDGKGKVWVAPKGTRTDGASIPQACMSFIGPPTDPQFRAAALVHDAYCAEANRGQSSFESEPWQQVHQMFYEACLAGGTPRKKALIMYAAVWMFGPRNEPVIFSRLIRGQISQEERKALEEEDQQQHEAMEKYRSLLLPELTDSTKAQQFKQIAKFINMKSPSTQELEEVMESATHSLQKGAVLTLPN